MRDEDKKFLSDILESIDAIEEYIGPIRLFENYEKNKMLRRAVEREIEIIGEAVNNLTHATPPVDLKYSRQIINTRNKVAHAYDAVNHSIIWGIIINHLPALRDEVKNLLGE